MSPPGWKRIALGDVVSLQRGYDLPSQDQRPGPYPIMGSAGKNGTHHVSRAKGPGVVIGRSGVGSMGAVSFCSEDYWPHNTTLFVTDFKGNDPRFVYYFLSRLNLRGYDSGSAQASLNRNYIYPIEINIPGPTEQRGISALLGSLDDKIEQNRRTGRKLEGLARAVFKAWFVDFEPVKAKAAGATHFPGMPAATFAALPTRLTDSPLGPVPEGWDVKPIADAFEVNPTRKLAKGTDAAYLDMKNMPTNGHAPDAWERRSVGSGMKFSNGDTLVARITPCLENGKTAYVDFLNEGEVAWGSTEYIVLRPKPPLPPIFAYCLARTRAFREFAIQNMSGTSGRQRVAATAMEHFHIAVPAELVAKAFGETVTPLFDSVRASINESAKLATLRDYLMPQLLSGKVRAAAAAAAGVTGD